MINLTPIQRKALEDLWFKFGNGGSKHTHGNHRFIQCILEHGDDDPAFWKRKSRIPLASHQPLTDECEAEVRKILA